MPNLNPRSVSVSVDFGTSHTVASIRRADGRVHQQLFDGSPQLPSAVFMNDEGGPVVGADAVHSGRRKPERYEPNPKRRIDDGEILLGDRELPVTSVIAAVLSRVARECEQTLGGSLGPVTVTVPAAWGPTRRHVIADAASAAGLGKAALVPEPVAAASYFVESLASDVPVGCGVVVYDLGGGTFDATVLRRTPSGFEVLAVDGADDLGGLDFDQALAEHVAGSVQPDDERWQRLISPESTADRRHRTVFLEEVRFAKERLSRSTSTDLTIPLLDIDAHLTRDELETVSAPLLERTMRITQGVIRESGLAKDQVAGLFLVGAASRMPLVATMLHRELGLAPAAIEQPELAVSEGGLVAGAVTSSPPLTPPPSPALPPQTPQAVPGPPPQTAPTMPMQAPPGSTGPIPAPSPMHSPMQSPAMTGPLPQRPAGSESWLKSKRGMATIGAGALALLLVIVALVAIPLLREDDPGDDGAAGAADSEPTEEAEDDSTQEASGGDGTSGSAGETSGVVDLDSATFGDPVSEAVQAHQGPVTMLRIAQLDGVDVAVTGGADGLVRVWDLSTGEELDVYRGHEYEISALSVTEYDGSPVVFSRDGETEAVWNLDNPDEPIDEREAAYGEVQWTGLLSDGTPAYLASGDMYQLFTGDGLGSVSSPSADAWTLMEVDGELRAVGIGDDRVIVTDLEEGENVSGTFDQLPNEVVAFNIGDLDGTALGVTATETGSIQAWDLASAEPYGTAATDSFQSIQGLEILSVTGGAAVLVWGSKGVNLFDLESGEQIEDTFAPPTGDDGEEGFQAAVAEIDGHRVAVTGSATGELEVWSINV